MNNSRRLFSGLLLIASWCCAATPSLRPFGAVEPHMGTLVRIKLYAESETKAQAAFQSAFARITGIDNALTDYQPDSELNRMCREASRHPVRVSGDLYFVLKKSQQLAEQTNGAFDVTIGPVSHLWRSARKSRRLPDPSQLREALTHVGYRKMHLDEAAHTVRLDQPGMQIDLGGIAKGYAADQALLAVRKLGIQSALIAASGDLTFSNAPPNEPGWKVGVDSVDQASAPLTRVLILSNAAVSTSGDTEQHLQAAGRQYSHIIDPRTGEGLTSRLTATVVAPSGIDADATATAIDVLGERAGLAYIENHPQLSALFLLQDKQPAEVLMSKRFRFLPSVTGGTL